MYIYSLKNKGSDVSEPLLRLDLLFGNCYRENQITRTNIVNYILVLDNLAEAGVNAVEVLGIVAVVADEELRATSVLASVCH